ncbi:hypothetical protein ASD54_23425 [Rhizobium sp. Root149]|uniref:hypothetical protein n=1 Tax=Rhizobium sp. Root149 TaxID=1736473 RepID=UPI000713B63E|nr:hypothetical protein [Rhizobium sp. Root149]KQZ59737.1 hypothetical protein ASD54_23425 [Rhizobium sp. Root149]
MKAIIAIAFVVASGATSAAYATGPLADSAGKVGRIVQGHGKAGETALASSDPSVTFETLANGLVRRTNTKYGTVTYLDPAAEAARLRNQR